MPARNSQSSTSWRWIAFGVVLFLVALAIALRNAGGDPAAQPARTQAAAKAPSGTAAPVANESSDEEGDGPTGRAKRPRERTPGGGDEDDGGRFPMLDAILDDDTMTLEESARRLRDISLDTTVSAEERLEAMAHGLNLDFESFETAAAEPALPLPLAERYLEALLNYNDQPKAQVRGCLNLMNHQDEGIRSRAMEQLAFVIQQESLASSPAELRQAAASYLSKAAVTPPAAPE